MIFGVACATYAEVSWLSEFLDPKANIASTTAVVQLLALAPRLSNVPSVLPVSCCVSFVLLEYLDGLHLSSRT